jgi:hypothetical protein
MTLRRTASLGAVIAAAITTATATAAATQPTAHAARTCSISQYYYTLGPTYVESLSVSGVSCATGLKVVKGYYKCRISSGGKRGYCHSKVLGFKCSEKRSSGPYQFIAKVRCTKGREVVSHTYSQNT